MDEIGPHPYEAGTVLSVIPHKPTTPAKAHSYVPCKEESDLMATGEWRDRVESVFRFPAPHPPQPRMGAPRKLRLGQVLVGGWAHGAQLVLCNWADRPSTTYVAKIYDPLYYEHPERLYDADDMPNTLTQRAYVEYVCESAAYQRIEANKASRPMRFTPDCFGSWAFSESDLTPESEGNGNQTKERFVYLIIIENIQGRTLQEIATTVKGGYKVENYKKLHDGYRLSVWTQVIEAENWLQHIGIEHNDMFSRNVMLEPPPAIENHSVAVSEQKTRVVIIDFGVAEFTDGPVPAVKLPPNPMSRWWHGLNNAVIGHWVPEWWEFDFPRRRQWLLKEFGGKRAAKYQKDLTLCDVHELTPIEKMYLQQMKDAYATE